jgi:RNAse (barnase) inhibitor barstar
MAEARLDGAAIRDFESFHDQCAAQFGFPSFYGRNMNAWIDCLTYAREGDGMSRFVLGPTEPLLIEVVSTEAFNRQAPEVFDAFVECTGFVNQRSVDAGELPALHVLFR